jgi:hypothetical protein
LLNTINSIKTASKYVIKFIFYFYSSSSNLKKMVPKNLINAMRIIVLL